MSSVLPLGTDLARVLAEGRMAWPGLGSANAWLNDIRRRGADAVGELPLPERRQEDWRYTSTAFLQQTDYRLEAAQTFDALQESDIEEILLPDEHIGRLVLVNGREAPAFGPLLFALVLTGGDPDHPLLAELLPPPDPQAVAQYGSHSH